MSIFALTHNLVSLLSSCATRELNSERNRLQTSLLLLELPTISNQIGACQVN